MKRLLTLLALAFLLAGCVAEPPPETTAPTTVPPTTQSTAPTSPPATIYRADSQVEAQTGGAVREYALGRQDCQGVAAMGQDLVLFFGSDDGTLLTLLSGDNGAVGMSLSLDCPLDPNSGSIRVTENGIGYYDSLANSVVILDEQFREIFREELPETVTTPPVICADLDMAFYCAGNEIRALDLRTGIARLVKLQEAQSITLLESLFDDAILACRIQESEEESYVSFLSVETGESLGEDEHMLSLASRGEVYLYHRMEGIQPEFLFGKQDEAPQVLNLDPQETVFPVLERNAVIGATEQDGSLTLWLYDLETGRRTAGAVLEGMVCPERFLAGPGGIWFLGKRSQGGMDLYRWDPDQSRIESETVYSSPRYTAENPDQAGLAACRAQAAAMSQTYGVDILLGDQVLLPDRGQVETEFQVPLFQDSLAALDAILSKFPQGFFQIISQDTASKTLHICLVRSVPEGCPSYQYWVGGDACIAIAVGGGEAAAFCHGLSHALDTFLVSKSQVLDQWEKLNPDGVTYTFTYENWEANAESPWVSGASPAFLDAYAMTYPREDRARIWEAVMQSGQSAALSAPAIQFKLRQLCLGIREACGYGDSVSLPWEQYLTAALPRN